MAQFPPPGWRSGWEPGDPMCPDRRDRFQWDIPPDKWPGKDWPPSKDYNPFGPGGGGSIPAFPGGLTCGVDPVICSGWMVKTPEKAMDCAFAILHYMLPKFSNTFWGSVESHYQWLETGQGFCFGPALTTSGGPAGLYVTVFVKNYKYGRKDVPLCIESRQVIFVGGAELKKCLDKYKSLVGLAMQMWGVSEGEKAPTDYLWWLNQNAACEPGKHDLAEFVAFDDICGHGKLVPGGVKSACGEIACGFPVVETGNAAALCASGIVNYWWLGDSNMESIVLDWRDIKGQFCEALWAAPCPDPKVDDAVHFLAESAGFARAAKIRLLWNPLVSACGSDVDQVLPEEPGYEDNWSFEDVVVFVGDVGDKSYGKSAVAKYVKLCELMTDPALPWGIGELGFTGSDLCHWLSWRENLVFLGGGFGEGCGCVYGWYPPGTPLVCA